MLEVALQRLLFTFLWKRLFTLQKIHFRNTEMSMGQRCHKKEMSNLDFVNLELGLGSWV
jgi:hypothetical protein